VACVNVLAAETDAEAEYLATSLYQMALGLIRNKRRPLQPPVATMDGLWLPEEKAAVQHMMRYSFKGSVETVAKGLQAFADETGVNEIMVASHVFDVHAKLQSLERLAPLFKKAG
jgi:alkanesulfonate monooxygenase SsuD/methylene tetrahydromethanopterin reductase-like flavin-dependent oxidoreductase (luciferase family)